MLIPIKTPPTDQNRNLYGCKDAKGVAAMIMPILANIKFFDMCFLFFQYIIRVGIKRNTAADQKYTEYLVKNSSGIPTIVMPINDKAATMPRHKL